MKRRRNLPVTFALVIALFLASVRPARASIPTGTQVVLIFVAVGVIGAGIGIAIYHVAHKAPSITGCAIAGGTGLSLTDESNRQTFSLVGDLTGIRAGERVKVSGKKIKNSAGSSFFIEKVRKDFGLCPVTP